MQVSFAPAVLHKALAQGRRQSCGAAAVVSQGIARGAGRRGAAQRAGAIDRAGANTLFGPRGACLASERGPLFVCDTGHHRLMIWRKPPSGDQADADFVIGQSDFSREGRNAKGEVGAATLNMPTGVAACDGVLAVADAWNHRVLIWHGYPENSNQPADVVLGQAEFTGGHRQPRRQRAHWRDAELVLWRRHRRWQTDRRRYRQSPRAGLERDSDHERNLGRPGSGAARFRHPR